jgi:diamine N-acetyltransferase
MSKEILNDKRNSRVYLRRISYKDALDLKNRTNFEEERLSGYNYGNFTDADVRFRYSGITAQRRKYFAIKRKEDDRFIGFLGLKNLNSISKKAKLGIVFDASFVSQGYGYEAMLILLDYFFDEMGYKELDLEVNDFNERAYRLYKKLGFKEYGKKTALFENQDIEFDSQYFVYKNGNIHTNITMMKIREDDR